MTNDNLFGEELQDNLQLRIHRWANRVFPNRTIHSALLKMYGEISECIDNPSDPGEWADVGILLFDLAAMNGVNIVNAMSAKMEINILRQWEVNEMGIMSHVKYDKVNLNAQAYHVGARDAAHGTPANPKMYNYTGEFEFHYMKGYYDITGDESSG